MPSAHRNQIKRIKGTKQKKMKLIKEYSKPSRRFPYDIELGIRLYKNKKEEYFLEMDIDPVGDADPIESACKFLSKEEGQFLEENMIDEYMDHISWVDHTILSSSLVQEIESVKIDLS